MEVLIFDVVRITKLSTNYRCFSRTKSIITYCSPLSITIDLHTSFINKVTSLKAYHTRVGITVPNPSSIYISSNKIYCTVQLTARHSSIIIVRITSTIYVCRVGTLQDSEVVVVGTIDIIQYCWVIILSKPKKKYIRLQQKK